MKLSEWLNEERGRGVTLASAIGVSPVLISQWSTGPRVPPYERCIPIERATHGAVTRCDLRPDDYLEMWPELAQAPATSTPPATENIADAQAAIRHVEAEAVAAIRQEADLAASEIKHAAQDALKPEAAPWDGCTERRQAEAPWDGVTERRKLDAPIDRRVSPESVARAEFLRAQPAGHKPEGV